MDMYGHFDHSAVPNELLHPVLQRHANPSLQILSAHPRLLRVGEGEAAVALFGRRGSIDYIAIPGDHSMGTQKGQQWW